MSYHVTYHFCQVTLRDLDDREIPGVSQVEEGGRRRPYLCI